MTEIAFTIHWAWLFVVVALLFMALPFICHFILKVGDRTSINIITLLILYSSSIAFGIVLYSLAVVLLLL